MLWPLWIVLAAAIAYGLFVWRLYRSFPTVRVRLGDERLDVRPLVQAARQFAFTPEAEPWRELAVDILLSGTVNGRGTAILGHVLAQRELLLELATALPAALLFAVSPEGASTRGHLFDSFRRRLLGARRRSLLPEGSS